MKFDLARWIVWFPVAFLMHDFEELIFFEPWLKKNGGAIRARVHNRVPAFVEKQLDGILEKTTGQFVVPIFLIFVLTCVSTLLAVEFGSTPFFLLAASLYFIHGFLHIGQAALLRRYVPALITSALVVLPYGAFLFWQLLAGGVLRLQEMLLYFLAAIVLAVPFMLGMHWVGELLYQKAVRVLVG